MNETIDTPRSAAALLRFVLGVAGIPNCSGESSTRYALRRMSELATQLATEMQRVEFELVLAKRELRADDGRRREVRPGGNTMNETIDTPRSKESKRSRDTAASSRGSKRRHA